jgi:glycine/D-amino acid oxidase-like deaminating enzyme
MASAAQQAGVDLRERVAVQRVTRTKHGFTVTTSAGEIRAEHIFAGVNGYADAAFPALRRRAIPVGSFMIATAPLSPATLATVAGAGEMRFDTRNFLSYWRPTPDGRIAFGGRTSFWPDSLSRIARQLRTRMVEIHPELADVAVTHAWGGRLAFAFDRLPRIARLNGVTHVAGCAGSGVALMTYLAEAAMDWEFGGPMPRAAELPWSPVPLPYEGFPWFLPLAGVGFAIEDALTER